MVDLQLLERMFKNINAIEALDILCRVFNATDAVVFLDHRRFSLYELYDEGSLYGGMFASEVEIRFFGGPPPGGWFNGTLLTLLLDHSAYRLAKGDDKTVAKALNMANKGCQC